MPPSHAAAAEALLSLTLKDVEEAERAIRGIAWSTPLLPVSRDDDGIQLKLECLQRLGSFKIRGIWNRARAATPAQRPRGFVTLSAGNAGQAVAWSAQRLQAPCLVYVPTGAVARKVSSMRAMGAEVREMPHEAMMEGLLNPDLPSEPDRFYVHPFGQPEVVAGQGTIGLEVVRALPEVGTILTAVGGGGLVGGIALAAKTLRPKVKVFGVQAEGAAPLPLAFETGQPTTLGPPKTFADGMAATRVFPYMWPFLQRYLDGAVRVSETELENAVAHLARECHVVVEGAGAAALAAAWKLRGTVPEPIVAIVSGGNIDPALLSTFLMRK
ncbi:MAG: threonine ammonia-lyase [Thermoplasmatota archaeon]